MNREAGTAEFSDQKDVQVVTVVITDILRAGKGTEGSPIRRVRQVWTLDGHLIAQYDPVWGAPGDIHEPRS